MTSKYWKLWQDRLEEAEDKSFQPLREMALTKHRLFTFPTCPYLQLCLTYSEKYMTCFMLYHPSYKEIAYLM